ncbi:MAG: CehA/McbA family metallohydrolase [Thermoprotei archaeon]
MSGLKYAQMHTHSKYSVNALSGEGVFHPYVWRLERRIMRALMHTPEDLAKEARRRHVDFVAITDHNTLPTLGQERWEAAQLIAGEEWGQKRGHANFTWIERRIDPDAGYFPSVEPEKPLSFPEAAAMARQAGAFITINHPFKKDSWRWGEASYTYAHAIEIWNGPWSKENERAKLKWQELLEEGLRIYAMAGNDYHVRALFHLDREVVALRNASTPSELLSTLRRGEYSLAESTSSPVVIIEVGKHLYYTIEKSRGDLELRVYTNRGWYTIKNPGERGLIEPKEGDKFVRIELWSGLRPLSFTNPVFL